MMHERARGRAEECFRPIRIEPVAPKRVDEVWTFAIMMTEGMLLSDIILIFSPY